MDAYFSHPIRGAAGESATPEQIKQACEECSDVAWQIEEDMGIVLYVPADHDEFVQVAYQNLLISERGILLADCEILSRRDFVLAYDPSAKLVSRGMRIEIEHALAIGKPVFIFQEWNDHTERMLNKFLDCLGDKRACAVCGTGLLEQLRIAPKNYITWEVVK
jgi:hypothetical protein